jgi:hypothetical protein
MVKAKVVLARGDGANCTRIATAAALASARRQTIVFDVCPKTAASGAWSVLRRCGITAWALFLCRVARLSASDTEMRWALTACARTQGAATRVVFGGRPIDTACARLLAGMTATQRIAFVLRLLLSLSDLTDPAGAEDERQPRDVAAFAADVPPGLAQEIPSLGNGRSRGFAAWVATPDYGHARTVLLEEEARYLAASAIAAARADPEAEVIVLTADADIAQAAADLLASGAAEGVDRKLLAALPATADWTVNIKPGITSSVFLLAAAAAFAIAALTVRWMVNETMRGLK